MFWIEFLIVLVAIAIGARLGGIAIGFAGGIGVVVLALVGVPPGGMPLDVIVIMMAVITTTAALQAAGGMDYLVEVTGRLLRRHPRQLAFLAPFVTWFLTVASGTGMSAFAAFPVITEVAKENDIRPVRPLSLSAIASMTGIVASPISAAVVYFAALLGETNAKVDYLDILAVTIPSTLLGIMATAAIMLAIDKMRGRSSLATFADWSGSQAQEPASGIRTKENRAGTREAKLSVWIFFASLVIIVTYAILISDKVSFISKPVMGRDAAIIAIMLATGAAIAMFCRVDVTEILNTSTFKSGGSSYVCALGVAWLGTTFIKANEKVIVSSCSDILGSAPWLLAIILVFASSMLYSQAATSKALMPLALSLVPASVALASFAAVAGFFILPTYPTVLGTVAIDDTGTTKIGRYVFNHPFIVPGFINMTLTVGLAFLLASIIL